MRCVSLIEPTLLARDSEFAYRRYAKLVYQRLRNYWI